MVCSKCGGRGRIGGFWTVPCDQCGGKGQCSNCSKCKGTGTSPDFKYSNNMSPSSLCFECAGSGIQPVKMKDDPSANNPCAHLKVQRYAGRGSECCGECQLCYRVFTMLEIIQRDYGSEAVRSYLPVPVQKGTAKELPTGRLFREDG